MTDCLQITYSPNQDQESLPETVLLTGTFTQWAVTVESGAIPCYYQSPVFIAQLPLERITNQPQLYKFIVDGQWKCDPLTEQVSDANGFLNHPLVLDDVLKHSLKRATSTSSSLPWTAPPERRPLLAIWEGQELQVTEQDRHLAGTIGGLVEETVREFLKNDESDSVLVEEDMDLNTSQQVTEETNPIENSQVTVKLLSLDEKEMDESASQIAWKEASTAADRLLNQVLDQISLREQVHLESETQLKQKRPLNEAQSDSAIALLDEESDVVVQDQLNMSEKEQEVNEYVVIPEELEQEKDDTPSPPLPITQRPWWSQMWRDFARFFLRHDSCSLM